MNSRLRILISYGIPLVGLSAFYWVASDGNHPDASAYRTVLYLLVFLVLPAGIAALITHLLLSFSSPDQRRRMIPFAFVGGLVGPALLCVTIATSTDPEARMGVILIPLAYIAAVPAVGTLALLATKVYDYRHGTKNA